MKEGMRKGLRWETERQRGKTHACAWDGEWVLLGALWNGKLESLNQFMSESYDYSLQGDAEGYIGEGNGNPLQCSCLENPRDGRAWWAAAYGVTQSWTQLKRLCRSGYKFGEKDYNSILRILTLKMPKKIHQVDCWVCKSGTKSRAYAFFPFPLSHCGIFVTHLFCIIIKMLFLPIPCLCTLLHKWHQCWALGDLFTYFLPWFFLSRFLTRFIVRCFFCLFVCFTYFALFLFKFSFVRFSHRENSSLILSLFETIFF